MQVIIKLLHIRINWHQNSHSNTSVTMMENNALHISFFVLTCNQILTILHEINGVTKFSQYSNCHSAGHLTCVAMDILAHQWLSWITGPIAPVRSPKNTGLLQSLGHIHHISHTSLPSQRAVQPNGSIQDKRPSGIIWLRIQSQGNQGTLMERHKNRPHASGGSSAGLEYMRVKRKWSSTQKKEALWQKSAAGKLQQYVFIAASSIFLKQNCDSGLLKTKTELYAFLLLFTINTSCAFDSSEHHHLNQLIRYH